MNDMNENSKVGDTVSNNIKTAHVFKKYGIDFCCGGGITIAKACEKQQVDVDTLMHELVNVDQSSAPSQGFNNWSLDFLTDYIEKVHHQYIQEAFQLLDEYMAKVIKVHGQHHLPLFEIDKLYREVKHELLHHLVKEEKVLFPCIKKLVQAKKEGLPMPMTHFGTVQNPIKMMLQEHDVAGDIMKEIASLSFNYTPPEWACNTFKALYAKLDEFEQDLHIHIHLENNILFPKAVELESSFNHKI